jgi:endonuclease/exonuclease/phosphatase family metal-dependent hydrolase
LKKYIKTILVAANLLVAGALLGAYLSTHINPEFFWRLAFLGLAFPVLLFLNLGFVFFWIMRRNRLLLISLIAILLGWNSIGKYLQFDLIHHKPGQNSFSVLSYNVRLFNYYRWEEGNVREEILAVVAGEKPDLVCFQEIFTVETSEKESEKYIDQTLGLPYKHIAYTHKPNPVSSYGIATYSRFPIVKKNTIRFKNSYNICIYTDLKINSDTVRVFNLHLQSIKLRKNDYDALDNLTQKFSAKGIGEVRDISDRMKQAYIKRARQVDELSRYVKQSPYPVLICGDFNDTPVSYTYRKVKGKNKDAFRDSGRGFGITYRGKLPFLRIDFIFHSPMFKSTNYKIQKVNYSDHYPVSCQLYKRR